MLEQVLHLNLGKQEQVLLQLLRGEALPQLWDSMDQVDQWDQVVLVGLVQEDKDLATE